MALFNDVLEAFLPNKKKSPHQPKEKNVVETDDRQSASDEDMAIEALTIPQPILRNRKMSQAQHIKTLYGRDPSFITHLPYAEYLAEEGVMLFDDAKSAGVIFDVKPIGTEGRSSDYLNRVRSLVKDALQDSFDELDTNPYVVQFYCQDDKDLSGYVENLRQYIKTRSPEAHGSEFTEQWLNEMERHLKAVGKPGGLFVDDRVTNTAWAGKVRKTRMVIYRYAGNNETDTIEKLNTACDRIQSAFMTAGLTLERQNEVQIHRWLLEWFNPNPSRYFNGLDDKTCYDLLSLSAHSSDLPLQDQDFSENLFFTPPESKNGYWYFNEQPHEVIVVDNIRKQPDVGHMTGEVTRGRNINALFDLLPESTIMAMTIVIHPQDKLQTHLDTLSSRAVGNNYESIYLKQDAITVTQYLKDGHKLYQAGMAFYVRGQDEQEIRIRSRELRTVLLSNNLVPVKEGNEVAPLNSYLRWLPMNFNPQPDAKSHFYTKYYWVQHLANMLPVFGRETGTGHPGITYFNRGGSPFDFDPLNPKDRTKNAHKLILGPTGSGKSATLTAQMAQLMAVHRPRLFIVEAGNSFGLFADYAERYGLTVNRVSLEPSSNIALPLFSEAHRLLEMDVELEVEDDDDNDEGEEQRDLLAEMELTARLMITGGEAKEDEKMSRADRSAIRQAILLAAEKTSKETPPRQVLTGDVKAALEELSRREDIRPERASRLADMAEAMDMFCTGVNGRFFNREGEIWSEADITLVDLAMFAREGYEAELAIAYISLINHINSLGEKYQHSFRPIVNITDESHIITVNPLLAKFLVKGSKMWRKLGIWLWLATQNMTDFPDESDKLLSMIEWWELLNLSNDEVEQVNRFRRLSEAQKIMLLSAKKADKKYTEGVVLATNMEALFRVVPPSLYLALGMTEKHEKAQRKQLMIEHHCSELDAALMVAKDLDRKRGIVVNDEFNSIAA